MHLSEEEYNANMEALLRRTQMLQHAPGSSNEGDVRTVQAPEGIDGSLSGGVAVTGHEDTATASTGSKDVGKFNDANEEPPAKE